ncbi:TetR/AcrR family transcriptional regulator [Tianweitania sediminis]|uniref:TetR/AcrR family transcriptional regulator n=1 Tax=Tianweitania sediminis TaxID=1502156 RepID=A0A8J7R2L1_9HYPH|nr:TetR/AcrR family transcriptional regulator [Tianweitania sediminis]MBP0439261.1 TetR/AcrR family transcriptional regulator [Tianweitania sediminis]
MQQERRRQQDRTDGTRAALLEAGRMLFVEKGFAGTSTPELVAATGLTRGALYHHYADKRALFAAVVEREAQAAAEAIETMPSVNAPLDALRVGSRVYLEAMSVPGRTRLLLLDGPAVLGLSEMDEIHARHGNRTLRQGLEAAMESGAIRRLPLAVTTEMLGALFDRAALSVAQGASLEDALAVVSAVLDGLRA